MLENQQKRWKQDKLISQPLFEENNLGGTLAKGLSNVGLHRVTEALAATDLIQDTNDGSGLDMLWRKKAPMTPGARFRGNHLEKESEGDRKIHGEGWCRRSENSSVGGVGGKTHKWRGREQNGGVLLVPTVYATLGAKRNDDDHCGFRINKTQLVQRICRLQRSCCFSPLTPSHAHLHTHVHTHA